MTDPDAPDPRSSLVKVRIGPKTYDAVYSPSCHTCTHPARAAIEEKVLLNYAYSAIATMYSGRAVEGPEGEDLTLPDLSWTSIRNHYRNGHMPLEHAAAAKLVERRSEEMAGQIETAVDRVIEHRDVVQTVLERGYERIQQSLEEPDVKDTLAAAKLLADLDSRMGGAATTDEAWGEAMQVYFETARRLMPPEMWARFTRELQQNPVLRAIEAKQNGDDVIDAEVVEA